jgi:hypothetical protein
MAFGATTNPNPPSPSTTAVLGDSWTILIFGVAFILLASHSLMYPESRARPCESMPRKSADNKTSEASWASSSAQPIFLKTDSAKACRDLYGKVFSFIVQR